MICKSCGTEGEGTVCAACGALLTEEKHEGIVAEPEETPAETPQQAETKPGETPAESAAPAAEPAEAAAAPEPKEEQPEPKEEQPEPKEEQPEPKEEQPEPKEEQPEPKEKAPKPKKEKKKKENKDVVPLPKHCHPAAVPFKALVAPAVCLFLPLIYFFIDVFGNLCDALAGTDEVGASRVAQLFMRLASPDYNSASVAEIVEGTTGSASAVEFISVRSLFSGGAGSHAFPMVIVMLLALCSAAAGVLIFLFREKSLERRWVMDLAIFGGFGATFAPLFAHFVWRLFYAMGNGFAAADEAAVRFSYSPEALLLMGILLLTVLPSVAALRKQSAKARGCTQTLAAPYRFLEKQPFSVVRLIAICSAFTATLMAVLYLFTPVLSTGSLTNFSGTWKALMLEFIAQAKAVFRIIGGNTLTAELPALVTPFVKLGFYLQLPCLLTALWPIARYIIRLFRVRPAAIHARKSDHTVLLGGGRKFRDLVLLPYRVCAIFQTVLAALLLFFSNVAVHLDYAASGDAMQVYYLTVSYAKGLLGTTTTFSVLAVLGVIFWHLSTNLARRMLAFADD